MFEKCLQYQISANTNLFKTVSTQPNYIFTRPYFVSDFLQPTFFQFESCGNRVMQYFALP